MIDKETLNELTAFYQDQMKKGILKAYEVTPIHDDNVILIELWRWKADPVFKFHTKIQLNMK